jgi:hypothetical protein
VPPPKADFAGPNAPIPFGGAVPPAPGQPAPGSFASRFPGGDRFNFLNGPTPVAPEAAGVLATPDLQQTVPPQPQPYPSATSQLPEGFNPFAGSKYAEPPSFSMAQLPWWPFANWGDGASFASSDY